MADGRRALMIGGHGRVAQRATPKLVAAGFAVTSMIRHRDQVATIEHLGATPLVRDVTSVVPEEWDEVLRRFDVVIWAAGNGGRAGADATYAVDRDAALATIDALERLGGDAPRYVMVSYVGSISHTVAPDSSFYPYADAKKTVDDRLLATEGIDYVILAPATLTDEPADGMEVIANDRASAGGRSTSRELVAEMIVEMAERETLPDEKVVAFVDGGGAVGDL